MGRARGWFCESVDCRVSVNAQAGFACWFASMALPWAVCAAKASWSVRGWVKVR